MNITSGNNREHWYKSRYYGSVNSKRAHPPRTFVGHLSLCFGNDPRLGRAFVKKKARSGMQMPHPGTTPILCFPVNMLQMAYLWEISK